MGILGSFRSPDFKTGGSENINTLDKVRNFSNWDHPSFAAENDKVKSFVENKLNFNKDEIEHAVREMDKLIDSDDIYLQELDEELWSKLQDDDSHSLSKIENETEFVSFINTLGKTGKELLNKILNNKMVEAPIVIKQKENFYVLTGEKRLKIFHTAGVTPMIKIIDLDTVFES